MKTIFKYPLTSSPITLSMPKGATILVAQAQNGIPTIWAEVDTDKPVETRTFVAQMTGQPLPGRKKVFVGTVQIKPFVYHIYELI